MPPQQLRQRTIECLVDHMTAIGRQQPILVVVEDAHWADPSMLEYVEAVVDAIESLPVFLVITSRREGERQWPDRLHLTPSSWAGSGASSPPRSRARLAVLAAGPASANRPWPRLSGGPKACPSTSRS